MKILKTILGYILGLITMMAIMFACAENEDGSCNLWWSLGCIAVAVVCGWLWNKYFNEDAQVIHIPDEVYSALNRQIADEASELSGGSKSIMVEEYFGRDYSILLKLDLCASSSRMKFTDDAWGYPRVCTEINWECSVEVVDVNIYNESGDHLASDFDENYIEKTYESSHWE